MKLLLQLVLAMLLVGAATAILARMHLGSCVDLPAHDEPSPDGRFVATRFDHSCTGSAIATTEVSLRAAALPFGTPAPEDVVLIASGGPPIDLSWRDGRTLVARTAGTILQQRPSWRSVGVVVQAVR